MNQLELLIDLTIGKIFTRHGKELSESVLNSWKEDLKDLTPLQLHKGVEKHKKNWNSDFMPTLPQFRELCLADGETTNKEDQARIAWGELLNAIRRIGSTSNVVFKDVALQKTIKNLGGWNFLCKQDEETLKFKERDFLGVYPAYLTEQRKNNETPFYFKASLDVAPTVWVGFSVEDEPLKIKVLEEIDKPKELVNKLFLKNRQIEK